MIGDVANTTIFLFGGAISIGLFENEIQQLVVPPHQTRSPAALAYDDAADHRMLSSKALY
jgi:hypothetical protein